MHSLGVLQKTARRLMRSNSGYALGSFDGIDPVTPRFRATTILSVRKGGMVAMIGDGQVSRGEEVVKNNGESQMRVARRFFSSHIRFSLLQPSKSGVLLAELLSLALLAQLQIV